MTLDLNVVDRRRTRQTRTEHKSNMQTFIDVFIFIRRFGNMSFSRYSAGRDLARPASEMDYEKRGPERVVLTQLPTE